MAKRRNDDKLREDYPADLFAISPMFCPGCGVRIDQPVDECPKCRFSGHSVVKKFSFAAPLIERYIDPDDYFGLIDRQRIDEALSRLARRFPQPRFVFCVIDLEPETDPREFAFWMLNASPVDEAREEKDRPWTILLLIDSSNGRVTVASGYAIEPFVDEDRWLALLQFSGHLFSRGDYGLAALNFVEGAQGVLSEGAERTERRLSLGKSRGFKTEGGWS